MNFHLRNDLSKVKCQYEMEKLLWENKKCFVGQCFKKNFPEQLFITNITESKGRSYYLMIRKKRVKVVGEIRKKMFDKIEDICNCIYNDYSQRHDFILRNYFPIFLSLNFKAWIFL